MKNVTPHKGMSFSQIEIRDLVKSWAALSLAFGLLLSRSIFSIDFLLSILLAAFSAGVAFLLHELAHKYLAQKYHCWAEFRSNDTMLLVMIALALFAGFILAAPGAVHISGYISRKHYGYVSAAGPITNFILAVVSLPFVFIFPSGILGSLFYYSLIINAWIGLFNMIPFGAFDGAKILLWNKTAYGVMVAIGFVLVGLSQNL